VLINVLDIMKFNFNQALKASDWGYDFYVCFCSLSRSKGWQANGCQMMI